LPWKTLINNKFKIGSNKSFLTTSTRERGLI
jgi:hypothetical protein